MANTTEELTSQPDIQPKIVADMQQFFVFDSSLFWTILHSFGCQKASKNSIRLVK